MSDERAVAPAAFAVELPVFVGPFKLLTDLILDQKIDVCDVVDRDRHRPVPRARERTPSAGALEEATWFLAACAVLLELKVGRLMPRHDVLDEEDLLGRLARPRLRAFARARRVPPRARTISRGGSRTRPGTSRARPGHRRSSPTSTPT